VHFGKLKLSLEGVSGFKDRIAQRTMQGKTCLYKALSKIADVKKVFGYQTSEYRKSLCLPKSHILDALCVATLRYAQGQALETGEVIALFEVEVYYFMHLKDGTIENKKNSFVGKFEEFCSENTHFRDSIEVSTADLGRYAIRHKLFCEFINDTFNTNIPVLPFNYDYRTNERL